MCGTSTETKLNLFLDEKEIPPVSPPGLVPNGFYEESCITDFPIRNNTVVLHVHRRRWKDSEGKSYSNAIKLAANGTRISKDFAAFFKKSIGRATSYREIFGPAISHKR